MLEIVGFWNDDCAAQWYRTLCPHLQDCERESLILEDIYFSIFSRSMYQQDIRHCHHLFSYLTMDFPDGRYQGTVVDVFPQKLQFAVHYDDGEEETLEFGKRLLALKFEKRLIDTGTIASITPVSSVQAV
jgi:hypothetical protein